jgi:hypothetical protein
MTRVVSRLLPVLASGRALHHQGLAAASAGGHADAERWFEAAASQYRRELSVEALARLRVHQLMVRARAQGGRGVESPAMIEIIRGLNRLDRLESLEAPFALGDARTVLAEWIERSEGASARTILTLHPAPTPALSAVGEVPAAQAA